MYHGYWFKWYTLVAAQDTVYQELMEAVKKGRKPEDRSMIPYTRDSIEFQW